MADWYQKTGAEALSAFDVTTDGLSSEQAAERLKKNGENVLAEGKKKTVLQVFLGQFADLLVLILIAAAIISMFSGNIESTIVIFAVTTVRSWKSTPKRLLQAILSSSRQAIWLSPTAESSTTTLCRSTKAP